MNTILHNISQAAIPVLAGSVAQSACLNYLNVDNTVLVALMCDSASIACTVLTAVITFTYF